MRFIERESVRFVLAGGFNTFVTYVAYLALLPFVNYAIAYSVTYVAGIFFAYYLSARFVFRRPLQWAHAIQYPLVYVVQYGLGIALTAALVEGLHLDAAYAPALVIVVTLPITFWMARWIIKREKGSPSQNSERRANITVCGKLLPSVNGKRRGNDADQRYRFVDKVDGLRFSPWRSRAADRER